MRQDAAPARLWAWGKRHLLKVLVAALAVLSVALAVVMASEKPDWALYLLGLDLLGPEDATRKTRAIELIGIAMGGVLLAIGATIANRRAVAMKDAARAQASAASAQAEAAAQQAEANKGAEDGRRQERLKTAIEHLGHASDSVRLGGAYELFHLAQETPDLRQTALDILCAHIRWTTGRADYREEHKDKPSTEIQSLLTLLFVQQHEVFGGCRIDLRGSWLNGANLQVARLQVADLSGAHLQRADLSEVRLQEADLIEAQLQGARLQGANLFEAHLQWANLSGAQLQEADLFGARLHGAHLQEADLSNARLQRVNLSEASMQGADLSEAYLQEANLFQARLQGTDLSGVYLQWTNLSEAQLQGSNLSSAQLQGANLYRTQLQGSNLFGTHLQGAGLSEAQLQGAISQPGEYKLSLRMRIHDGIGRESDLSGAIFAGGLSRKNVDSFVKVLRGENAEAWRRRLERNIDEPANHELPENSGAITGTYTKEEAELWIAEYEQATGEG